MSKINIAARVIKPINFERVVEFLRIHFYRDEPLSMGIEPKYERASSIEYTKEHIAHGACLMAVEQSEGVETILGVAIAAPKYPDEAKLLFEKAAAAGPSKLGHIMLLLACIERDANVFQRYGVARALHVHSFCVMGNRRGAAIGMLLLKEMIALARKQGYPVMTGSCTSNYSARLCVDLGSDCIHELRYNDYLNSDGKPIFCPPAPHESVKTYALKL